MFLSATAPAFAHTLKRDGNIGAVIHINPEDDPIANEQSSFYFDIKDRQNKFKLELCDCNVAIYQNDAQIFTIPLYAQSQNGNFTYTFPGKGVYQVKISGTPRQAGAFQPFTLSYDIRVEREAATVANAGPVKTNNSLASTLGRHWYHYLAIVFITAAFLIFLFIDRMRGRIKKNQPTMPLRCWFSLFLVALIFCHTTSASILTTSHLANGHDVTQHNCCMPQLTDTTPTVVVNPLITIVYQRPVVADFSYSAEPTYSINNKSPPETT